MASFASGSPGASSAAKPVAHAKLTTSASARSERLVRTTVSPFQPGQRLARRGALGVLPARSLPLARHALTDEYLGGEYAGVRRTRDGHHTVARREAPSRLGRLLEAGLVVADGARGRRRAREL